MAPGGSWAAWYQRNARVLVGGVAPAAGRLRGVATVELDTDAPTAEMDDAGRPVRRLGLPLSGAALFHGADVRRLAIGLRKRRPEEAKEIDAERTAIASAKAAGYFSPVAARRHAEPEYLVVGQRRNARDQEARLEDELLSRLRDHDVAILRYYFQSDPRVCTDAKGDALSLAELSALHPAHELWLGRFDGGVRGSCDGRAGTVGIRLAAVKDPASDVPGLRRTYSTCPWPPGRGEGSSSSQWKALGWTVSTPR